MNLLTVPPQLRDLLASSAGDVSTPTASAKWEPQRVAEWFVERAQRAQTRRRVLAVVEEDD
eukprot:7776051-Pyramimonas_sp.AAC.1